MSDQSAIEWTDATWNPTYGCTKIAPECANCYIERTPPYRMAGLRFEHGKIPLQLLEDRLDKPINWKKPKRIFVNSLSDLFHEDVPDDYIAHVYAVMALANWHTYQVLTKRGERMQRLLSSSNFAEMVENAASDYEWLADEAAQRYGLVKVHARVTTDWRATVTTELPLPSVWQGVSVGVRKRKSQIDLLRKTPARVRFLSVEPLLEDLGELDLTGIQWVIVGGESGPGARPMHPGWARSVRDQCQAAGVPFFFKQWGELAPLGKASGLDPDHHYPGRDKRTAVHSGVPMDEPTSMFQLGKKVAGRLLDGRTWDEMPVTA